MRKGLIAAIAAAGLGLAVAGCQSKPELPDQFKSLDGTIAGEYLLAATAGGKNYAYQRAVDSTDDPDLKTKISAYASNDLYRQAKNARSNSEMFMNLERAVIIAPSQEAREMMIDSSLAMVEPYREHLDVFHSGVAALYLRSMAVKTNDPKKRIQLLNQAADIYAGLANIVKTHEDRANYLSVSRALRQSTP